MSLEFYDRHGQPCLYTEDDEILYSWDGFAIAYLYGEHVYLFNGEHFGWLKKGWMVDDQGYRVYFSQKAVGGPLMPTRHAKPYKEPKHPRPAKLNRAFAPPEPLVKDAWADYAS